jgi:TatD DNase family protein
MIDSHCHLTDPRLHEQLDDVLSRASAVNVTRVIAIGTNISDAIAGIDVCRGRENVRCAIGIHPNYCQKADLADVDKLRELQRDPSVVALGEMGLDYFHNFADRNLQRRFFEAQLALAVELNRPIVIHSREAIADTLEVLKGAPGIRAVFHSFTGTLDEAMRIIEAGFLLGFTGPITFKKNDVLREAVKRTPHNRLLVETDAPYLTPEPMRKQKINEPAMVVHTAGIVAQQWGISIDETDQITTRNVERFFGWK